MSNKPKAEKKLKKESTSKQQKEQEAEVKRQRAFIKDSVYPFLLKNTESISDAKRLCYEVQQALTQKFQLMIAEEQKKLSEQFTSSIAIEDITKRGDGFKRNKELYDLFLTEKISTTNALLGGMATAFDSFVNEEISKRKLETLKTDFL